MTREQHGLFDEDKPQPFEEVVRPVDVPYQAFLPGIKPDEAYPDLDWSGLEKLASQCNRCPLRAGCHKVVFGDGPTRVDIMLVGEGPGQSEDEIGKPFVGKAGQLLDKILEATGFPREKLYIANIVKCRPPNNRLPNPNEIAACRGYLEAQIRLCKPQILVCLGALATQTIIEPKAKITVVRGKWFTRQNVVIMPTYHPAALLRNESLKRPVWEDFKLIRQEAMKRGITFE